MKTQGYFIFSKIKICMKTAVCNKSEDLESFNMNRISNLDVKNFDFVHSSAVELIKQYRSQIRGSPPLW